MDAPNRGASTLVYFIAISLVGYGLLEMALYWGECLAHKQAGEIASFSRRPPFRSWWAWFSLVRAKAVAKWLADKLE